MKYEITKRTLYSVFAIALLTGAAVSHSGVKDPLVKARMHLMTEVSSAMKTLTQMANGERTYNAQAASDLADKLADHASAIPGKFETFATDPKTEALDSIWEEWEEFVRISSQMEDASKALTVPNLTLAEFRMGLTEMGKTCLDCHQGFRKKK